MTLPRMSVPIASQWFVIPTIVLVMFGCGATAHGQLVTYEFEGKFVGSNSLFNLNDTFSGSYTFESSSPAIPHPDSTLDVQAVAISNSLTGTGWTITVNSSTIGNFTVNGTFGYISVGNDTAFGDRYIVTLAGAGPLPGGLELNFFQIDVQDPVAQGADALSDGAWQGLPDLSLLAGDPGGRFFSDSPVCSQCPHRITSLGPSNEDPVADAGPDQSANCDSANGALLTLDGSGSSDPDEDTLTYQWSVPASIVLDDPNAVNPSGVFPIGITLATLTVTDGNGGVDCDDVEITVVDVLPPEVSCTTDLMRLWPPNGQMEDVDVFIDATDNCTNPGDLVLMMVTLESDEPDDANGNGDGATTGDVNGSDGFIAPVDTTNTFVYNASTASFEGTIQLRAEREGSGSGRTYTITAHVLDNAGNLAETSCVVVVPHDRRGGN